MFPLSLSLPTVTVSLLYCLWHIYHKAQLQHEQFRREQRLRDCLLRERVACLLWAIANLPDPREQTVVSTCGPSQPTPLWQWRCPALPPPPPRRRRA
jgi:hypothetical protein